MVLSFDCDHLKKRLKTELLNDGNVEYWGIYDFSYKYRTRIYDHNDNEIAYVEKDIYENGKVNMFDYKGNSLGKIIRTENGYEIGDLVYKGNVDAGMIDNVLSIEEGKMTITDESRILLCIMCLFGLIEIERGND